jgi:hypothetical protein
MTTMAALFGAVPIALGYGAGGEACQPLGLVVVGSLLFSQLVTFYLTPVFYIYMSPLQACVGAGILGASGAAFRLLGRDSSRPVAPRRVSALQAGVPAPRRPVTLAGERPPSVLIVTNAPYSLSDNET